MVTYCVTKMIPTCSPVIGQFFFDTMIVASSGIKSGHKEPSKSTSCKVLETVMSHLNIIVLSTTHISLLVNLFIIFTLLLKARIPTFTFWNWTMTTWCSNIPQCRLFSHKCNYITSSDSSLNLKTRRRDSRFRDYAFHVAVLTAKNGTKLYSACAKLLCFLYLVNVLDTTDGLLALVRPLITWLSPHVTQSAFRCNVPNPA